MLSPSSKKVDDFLSSLSQLSQDRLKEDQKRQRSLQRNIDELRLRLASTSPVKRLPRMSTSRGTYLTSKEKFYQDLEDLSPSISEKNAPPLPLRKYEESPPVLPRRKYLESTPHDFSSKDSPSPTPTLPRRKYEEESPPPLPTRRDEFSIDLVRPIAKTAPPKPTKKADIGSNLTTVTTLSGSKLSFVDERDKSSREPREYQTRETSFVDMERSIKTQTQPEKAQTQPEKPPAKSEWLSSTLKNLTRTNTTFVPKPSYYNAISAAQAAKVEPKTQKPPTPENKPTIAKVDLLKTPEKRSWIDSVVSRETPHDFSDTKRNFVINKKASPEAASTSWLDSVAQKQRSSNSYTEPTSVPFRIVKSGTSSLDLHKPQKVPEKPDFVSQIKHKSAPKPPPKPKPSDDSNDILKNHIGRLSPTKTLSSNKAAGDDDILKSQLGRLSPSKTAEKKYKDFLEKDTQELKQSINKLGTAPKPPKPTLLKYEEKDSEALRSKLNSLGKKSIVPKKEDEKSPEGLVALAKLKKAKPPPPKAAEKPEALKKLDSIKREKQEEKEEPKDKLTQPPGSFQDKLSSILRANTLPSLQPKSLPRTNTDPIESREPKRGDSDGLKLTHINKSRARGPKRRLPKSMQKEGTKTEPTPQLQDKPKKPPIKPKKPQIEPRHRQVSGELFI